MASRSLDVDAWAAAAAAAQAAFDDLRRALRGAMAPILDLDWQVNWYVSPGDAWWEQ